MAPLPAPAAGPSPCASMRPRRVRLGWGNRHVTQYALRNASMRPRRVRLGWEVIEWTTDWVERASMRPRRVRLGWIPQRETDADAGDASMRPRRVRLGWSPGPRALECIAVPASMRPRRVRLGWPQPDCAGRAPRRCFNEAEARTPRMDERIPDCRHCCRGFNEAEARTPRMASPRNPLAIRAKLSSFRARVRCGPTEPARFCLPSYPPCQRALGFQRIKPFRAGSAFGTQ